MRSSANMKKSGLAEHSRRAKKKPEENVGKIDEWAYLDW